MLSAVCQPGQMMDCFCTNGKSAKQRCSSDGTRSNHGKLSEIRCDEVLACTLHRYESCPCDLASPIEAPLIPTTSEPSSIPNEPISTLRDCWFAHHLRTIESAGPGPFVWTGQRSASVTSRARVAQAWISLLLSPARIHHPGRSAARSTVSRRQSLGL